MKRKSCHQLALAVVKVVVVVVVWSMVLWSIDANLVREF